MCQRAALLVVRGSRTPCYKENTKAVSEDFRLTVHEAVSRPGSEDGRWC